MNHQTDIAIQLTNISKKYKIHHEKPTLVEKFIKGNNETFWALKDINLTIKKGEKIGIIGPNGSGKTTMLKVISGITTPTTGSVTREGKVVSLIDLEAGFHEDLTGEQNIFLNGMLLGMNKQEINANLKKIIRFADIHQFIDTPLYTYSAGMKLRLGFAVAIHSKPDILVLDESLSTGDKYFHKKTQRLFDTIFKQGITIIVVSHWLQFINSYCKRILLIKNGQIAADSNRSLITKYVNNY